jgi:hypothetical protein
MSDSAPSPFLVRRLFRYPGPFSTGFCVLATLLLLGMFLPMLSENTKISYPYEDWDEIGTFNNSRVLAEPESYRSYRYGSLDTARFIIARLYYETFDPIGKTSRVVTFSNNRPESLDDPHFPKRAAAHPPRTHGPDYAYYRGVNDRQPIFIARELYAVSVVAAHVLLVFTLLYFLRSRAGLLLLLPLVLYTNIYFFGEAALARGNAFNAISALGVFLFLFIWLTERRSAALYAACCAVALGTAHKFDFLFYSLPVALAAIGGAISDEKPVRALFRTAGACLLAFLLPLLVFWPLLLVNPNAELKLQFDTLRNLGTITRPWSVRANEFATFSAHTFRMNPEKWSVLWRNAIPLVLVGAIPFLFLSCTQLSRRVRIVLVVTALSAPLHWAYIYSSSWSIVPRYLLTSLAFSVGALTCFLHLWTASGVRWRQAASGVLLLTLSLGAYKLYLDRKFATTEIVRASLRAGDGLWQNHSRNQAVVHAATLALSGEYSKTVLVDQHSYTDLRYFWLKELEPIYINAGNLRQVLSGLEDSKPHLIVFTPADPKPSGRWANVTQEDPEFTASYQIYRTAIEELPLLREFGSTTMQLLDYGQIDSMHRMQVRSYRAPETNEGSTGNRKPQD